MANSNGIELKEALECVGEGWHTLVKHVYQSASTADPKIIITQVKEKFGRLRIYWDSPERQESKYPGLLPFCDVVAEAERRSGNICELCGNPGRVATSASGWLMARCKEHYEHSI